MQQDGIVSQNCLGTGIYAENSIVKLLGGTISKNRAENSCELELVKPTQGSFTDIRKSISRIMGVGAYFSNSKITISGGVTFSYNTSKLSPTIKLNSNTKINETSQSQIYGNQLFISECEGTIGKNSDNNYSLNIIGENKNAGVIQSLVHETKKTDKSISSDDYGGGLAIYNSNLTINKLSIKNCTSTYGGGLNISKNSDVKISNSLFDSNTANAGGGLNSYGKTVLSKTKISNNVSKNVGGGIYTSQTSTVLNNVTITANIAQNSGGAIYSNNDLTLSGTNTLINNNTAQVGAGIMQSAKGTLLIKNGKITNNTASKTGGGIATNGKTILNLGEISNNVASSAGAGIKVLSNGKFIMNGGNIINNSISSGAGGGVSVSGKFIMHKGKISGNTATTNGGGVCYSNASFYKLGGTISGNKVGSNSGANYQIYPKTGFLGKSDDKKAPTITIGNISTAWIKNSRTISITAKDSETDVINLTITEPNGNKKTISTTDGSYTFIAKTNGKYKISAIDFGSNKKEVSFSVTKIDNTSPTLQIDTISTNIEKTKNIKITSDDKESGVKLVKIRDMDGYLKVLSLKNNVCSYTAKKNGKYDVIVYDKVNNQTTKQININSIDNESPKLNINYSETNSTPNNVTVTITSNEKIQKVNGWTLQNNTTLTKKYINNTTVNVTVNDLVGNSSIAKIKINNIIKATGDLNNSGTIDPGDLLKIYRYLSQKNDTRVAKKHPDWNLDNEKQIIGDLNKNGTIDFGDILKLNRYIAAKNNIETAKKHPDWLSI